MSATDEKTKTNDEQRPSALTRLSYYQINPSYTVRVICCVAFIFLTEICLAHYVYRLIKAEMGDEFVARRDFRTTMLMEMHGDFGREEMKKLLKEIVHEEEADARNREEVVRVKREIPLINDGPNVEFFNPRLRGELEAKDELERQRTGNKGSAPGGDSWVWLTSYSRIPVSSRYIIW
jgi:hypothetical protein